MSKEEMAKRPCRFWPKGTCRWQDKCPFKSAGPSPAAPARSLSKSARRRARKKKSSNTDKAAAGAPPVRLAAAAQRIALDDFVGTKVPAN